MENFDEIIKPLLEKRHYVKTIKIGAKPSEPRGGKPSRPPRPVITPLGKFPSAHAAANAHEIRLSALYGRIYKQEGYEYDEQGD